MFSIGKTPFYLCVNKVFGYKRILYSLLVGTILKIIPLTQKVLFVILIMQGNIIIKGNLLLTLGHLGGTTLDIERNIDMWGD